MKHRIFCLLFGASLVMPMLAQSSVSDINQIKRDGGYLYGESTLDNREAALKLAYELLEAEIKNWAIQKNPKTTSVLVSKIFEYADTIILPRRNMVRAFVFVKKSNLKAIKGKTMTVEVCQPERAKETALAKKSEPVMLTKPEPAPEVKPEPVIEEPAQPVVVKTTEEQVLEQLMKVTKFQDLEGVMTPLKKEGKILDLGKYATMKDAAGSYLIVYDQQGTVRAFLGKGTTTRRNLKTGADDSEKNYHGCGALWFKVKE